MHQAAAAHWHTYKHLLAEIISVSQLAMINDDFAEYGAEMCSIPTSFDTEMVRGAQFDGYCAPDDEACIRTLTNVFYRAIYDKEGS